MRLQLMHHARESLLGDFEPPPALASKKHLTAWSIGQSTDGAFTAAKLQRGCAVWAADGKLLQYFSRGGDVVVTGDSLLLLDNTFGACRSGKGVRHRVCRLRSGTWEPIDEAELCVPSGGVERLIVNRAGNLAVATWLEQSEWGYIGVALATLTQTELALRADGPTLSPPAFSPDDSFVVACHFARSRWWTDEPDDWYAPSRGGLRTVGRISVQSVGTGAVSLHDVLVELPPGWLPDRPEESEWAMLWGPDFVSDEAFRVWMPDGTTELLTLPLPSRVIIDRPIATTRTWGN